MVEKGRPKARASIVLLHSVIPLYTFVRPPSTSNVRAALGVELQAHVIPQECILLPVTEDL